MLCCYSSSDGRPHHWSRILKMVFAKTFSNLVDYPLESLLILSCVLSTVYILSNEFVRYMARIKGFKGPPGLLMIGNLEQIQENAAEQYRQWSAEYGPVYQIQLGNIPIIVVNTAASAKTLFSQNSQALSSRPEFYTFHKVSWLDHVLSYSY